MSGLTQQLVWPYIVSGLSVAATKKKFFFGTLPENGEKSTDLTFLTIIQEIFIVITSKPQIKTYLLITQFEQPNWFCGMLLMIISKT